MDQATIMSWLVLLHVLSALGFVAMHGVSMYVLLRLRRERDPDAVRSLLNVSAGSILPTYAFLGLILLTGIAGGIVGGWWTSGKLWIWASMVILVAVFLYMSFAATGFYGKLRAAGGLPYQVRGKEMPVSPADDAALLAALNGPTPLMAVLGSGVGGIIVLTWLMYMKPF